MTMTSVPEGRAVYEASQALRSLCRAVGEAESTLARGLDLSAREYRAVKHVLYAEQAPSVSELAAHLGVSKGSASEMVDRVEARGLVRRAGCVDDGRRVVLHATALAVAHVHATLGEMFGALAKAAARRDAATLDVVAELLRDATDLIHASPPGRPVDEGRWTPVDPPAGSVPARDPAGRRLCLAAAR